MTNQSKTSNRDAKTQTRDIVRIAVPALVALAATFLISNLDLSFSGKALVFSAIAIAYIVLLVAIQTRRPKPPAFPVFGGEQIGETVEGKLFALEEASEFFGASLKSADMFRLVASRINEILPFAACVLYLTDDESRSLTLKYAFGQNPEKFADSATDLDLSLAAKAFLGRSSQLDQNGVVDRRVFAKELIDNFGSAIAVPLFKQTEIFGVVVIYAAKGSKYDGGSVTLAEAIAERAAPLFSSSFAFERSVSNALTDNLTNLPNERGFFLVLENQVAESQRFREERPLTVLALDIRNFDEINSRHGHVVGDAILEFVSEVVKRQLRQMDVLTRSAGDEFLAVLPTAGERIAEEIKERISRAFVAEPYRKPTGDKLFVELNFGSATFWRDGETAPELLRAARIRKDQDKNSSRGKVLWFPKEYIN